MKRIALTLAGLLVAGASAAQTYEFRQPIKGLSVQQMVESAPEGLSHMTCGYNHCYALIDGFIWSSGSNTHGQRALPGAATHQWTNTHLRATHVIAAGHYGLALSEGYIWAVGINTHGNLGLGDNESRDVWTNTGQQASDIHASRNHALAIHNGFAYAAGSNRYGKLGLGSVSAVNSWTPIGQRAQRISTNVYISLIIHDGYIYGTGRSHHGQSGVGNRTQFTNSNRRAIEIAAGSNHSYAISPSGKLMVTGRNQWNQHGQPGGETHTWRDVSHQGIATAIASGYHHGYAIIDGSVYSAGYNDNGQLARSSGLSWASTGIQADKINAFNRHGVAINGQTAYVVGSNASDKFSTGTGNLSSWVAIHEHDISGED